MKFSLYTLFISKKNCRQLWSVVLSLCLLSIVPVAGAALPPRSVAVRCDGSKESNIGYEEKIFYFNEDIQNLTKGGIVSFIQKADGKDCHEFYLMKKEKVGDAYVMQEQEDGGNFDEAGDELVEVSSYFDWNGSEDLSHATKGGNDLSMFKFKQADLITADMYKHPDKYKNRNSSNDDGASNKKSFYENNFYSILIGGFFAICIIGGGIYLYTNSGSGGDSKEEKKN